MINNTLNISPVLAREIAQQEAGVRNASFMKQRLNVEGGLNVYELTFRAESMDYVCYIDADSGEVLGFDCWPVAA